MSLTIETWQWLSSPEGLAAIVCAPPELSASVVDGLRKHLDADRVRGVLEASGARRKAAQKLDSLWTSALLADLAGVEMASSANSARYKSQRFSRVLGTGARVADLCCGIGGDSWGLLGAGLHVVGVDSDPTRAVMYAHNMPQCGMICGDALEDCPADVHAFHLDPARRAGGKRALAMEDFLPGPKVWDAVIERVGAGAIKLNPGVDAYALPEGEVEILSEPVGLTQAVLWVGSLAGAYSRRATMIGDAGVLATIRGEPLRPDDTTEIGSYIGTLDPCLERADLVGVFLDENGVSLVHPGTGLVTSEAVALHPMVRWYRVLEVLTWNEKRVRAALRGYGHGLVEVRTRGGAVNPDTVQRALRGSGDRDDLSVLIYRLGDRVMAVIAEGVDDG